MGAEGPPPSCHMVGVTQVQKSCCVLRRFARPTGPPPPPGCRKASPRRKSSWQEGRPHPHPHSRTGDTHPHSKQRATSHSFLQRRAEGGGRITYRLIPPQCGKRWGDSPSSFLPREGDEVGQDPPKGDPMSPFAIQTHHHPGSPQSTQGCSQPRRSSAHRSRDRHWLGPLHHPLPKGEQGTSTPQSTHF